MAEYVGSGLYITFGGTVLHSDFRTFETEETVDLVDSSAGADVAKTYLKALEDGTASIELVDQTTGTLAWAAIKKGSYGTLVWSPEGTASGKPKYQGLAYAQSRGRSQPYNDIAVLNASFQFSGTISDLTW